MTCRQVMYLMGPCIVSRCSLRHRAFLKGGQKKRVRNINRNERSRARSVLHGHGTFSTSKVGGWRLVIVGWWRLVVGSWRVVPFGGWWQLAAVGGWQLAVGGPWGLSLKAVLNKKKNSGFLKTALLRHPWG